MGKMKKDAPKITFALDADLAAKLDAQRAKVASDTGLRVSMGQIVRRAIHAGLAAYES